MYLDYFNLKRNPFPSTPQLDFYYSGGERESSINAIDFGLQENFGIIKVIGQTGCGKTMLCRQAYRQLSDRYDILFISDPSLDSCHSILSAVASELNPEWDVNKPKNKLFQQVMQTLVQQSQTDRPTILFIEEAQKITPTQFEELRYLTNLETSQDKLMQIVLFGQPSLDASLLKADVQLLSSRITHTVFLKPLSFGHFIQYVHHRLTVAGHSNPEQLFSNMQLGFIYTLSNGSLRHANQLLEKVLFASYIKKRKVPYLLDIATALRSMSKIGAELRYTRAQLLSVFSIGLFMGWLVFTSTEPLRIDQSAQQKTDLDSYELSRTDNEALKVTMRQSLP